jgi:carbon storage regulator CsrA
VRTIFYAAIPCACGLLTRTGRISRKLGERILVPHCELTVTIAAIEGNNVRLGILARDDVAVHREEVWLQAGQLACEKVSAYEGQRRPR